MIDEQQHRHRMQPAELQHRRHPQNGLVVGNNEERIPIPNFHGIAAAVATPSPNPHCATSKPPLTTFVPAPAWNETILKQVETFLSIQYVARMRSSRQQVNNRSVPLLLPIPEFRTQLKRLIDETTESSNPVFSNKATGDILPQYKDLEQYEAILLDMLCLGSPKLYKLSQRKVSSGKDGGWFLEVVPFKGNRVAYLTRSMASTKSLETGAIHFHRGQILQLKSDEINRLAAKMHSASRTDRASPTRVSGPTSKPTTQNQSDISLRTPTQPPKRPSTIDERVRERAAARVRQEDDRTKSLLGKRGARLGSSSSATENKRYLRLVDAMWVHSRQILKTQSNIYNASSRLHNSRGERPSSSGHCTMTLGDLMDRFSDSLMTAAYTNHPVSKRKAIAVLDELHQFEPRWITLAHCENLSTRSTVWICPSQYRSLRTKLGFPLPERQTSGLKIKKSTFSLKRTLASQKGTLELASLNHSDLPRPHKPSASPGERPLLPAKKRRVSTATTIEYAQTISLPANQSFEKDEDRASSIDERKETGVNPSPKQYKRNRLRVNSNFILLDADYHGGEVISPSLNESPRGLKRMFSQMNEGRRI